MSSEEGENGTSPWQEAQLTRTREMTSGLSHCAVTFTFAFAFFREQLEFGISFETDVIVLMFLVFRVCPRSFHDVSSCL